MDHINPGTTITRRFEVTNNSGKPHPVNVHVTAAEIRDNSFRPADDRNANELPSWITIDQPTFLAPPHSRTRLTARISIPPNATKGERYGAIVAEVASPTPGQDENVQIVNGVGIRVYLDIGLGGDPPSDFRIDQVTPGRTEQGVPIVKADVHNTGERALDIDGQLWLSGSGGRINAGPFRAQRSATLAPGSGGRVTFLLDEQLVNGPWDAKLTLESGRIRRTFTGTLTFPDRAGAWGLPSTVGDRLPLILAVVGALIVMGSGGMLFFVRKGRWRRRASAIR
ncbi:hypothetical protein [Micromonospora sp. KC213]|uniref:hypothetical protein n=1 Tax=Micromonospora sp. KC213 TaxID=2530378 RepID=UPI00104F40ED|nr:hypothetical protein [Micromonospora sp. KC213]TDC44141.1 hypothetical protein E1166_01175 [Micromonospora sp. KC213]